MPKTQDSPFDSEFIVSVIELLFFAPNGRPHFRSVTPESLFRNRVGKTAYSINRQPCQKTSHSLTVGKASGCRSSGVSCVPETAASFDWFFPQEQRPEKRHRQSLCRFMRKPPDRLAVRTVTVTPTRFGLTVCFTQHR